MFIFLSELMFIKVLADVWGVRVEVERWGPRNVALLPTNSRDFRRCKLTLPTGRCSHLTLIFTRVDVSKTNWCGRESSASAGHRLRAGGCWETRPARCYKVPLTPWHLPVDCSSRLASHPVKPQRQGGARPFPPPRQVLASPSR